MSSQGSPTLDLDVRSRRTERRIASATIAAATASPWLMQLDPMFLVLISLCAGLAATMGFWRAGWIGVRHRLAGITWLADGRWLLTTHAGTSVEANLGAGTRSGAALAWLRWQAPHRYSMLLTRVDLANGELRRLLVRLSIDRLQRPPALSFAEVDTDPGSAVAAAKIAIRRTLYLLPVARTRRR